MTRPLDGIRVVDCTHVLAGPYCGYQLGLLGAEVIRIDRVDETDFVRWKGPDETLNDVGMSPSFMVQGAGKKSLALDLKDPRGQEILKKLVATADVMTENYRPGKLARLGLAYDDMKALKEDLIYCSLTGFGQTGPLRDFPAYDYLVQGISGYMLANADKDGEPWRIGFPIIDYLTGLSGAFAVMTALFQRQRTGKGQYVDVAMLEAALAMLGPMIGALRMGGGIRRHKGNSPSSGSPYSGVYEAKDGALVVVANTPAQAISLARVLDRPDLVDDPRLQQSVRPQEVIDKVQEILRQEFAGQTLAEWEERLQRASVPAGRLRALADVLAEPHLQARGFLHQIDNVPGIDRDIQVPGIGFRMAGADTSPLGPPPLTGAHGRELLGELGYTGGEVDKLIADGVTREP